MASTDAIRLLVQANFDELCETHNGRPKCILRLNSCDIVCSRCIREEPTIKVVKLNEINGVWLDKVEEFVDCSRIQKKDVQGRELIQLKANHREGICEENNFCSLACKVKNRVKKKRTWARIRGHVGIFHRFFQIFLMKKKPRSGGRIPRRHDRHLPPKKRRRG